MLLAFADEWAFARRLARAAALPLARIRRHRFPDGELQLTLPPRLPHRVVLLRSLHAPNEKLFLPNFYRGIDAVRLYLERLGAARP